MERPGLRRLLQDIDAGLVDCVIVYKVDRLSRSLLDFARIMETFEKQNVSFVSVTQQFNTTHSMGRLTLNILLSFAQFEREIIGERIRDKIAAQRRRGKWAGGIPVLGYDVDRSTPTPKLAVNASEAARVVEIYQLYLKLGSLLPVSDELIKRDWRNKAWVTRKGQARGDQPFDKGSLYVLLTNPIYIGKVRHKTDLFDGEHTPIVDPDLFQQVQTQLQHNGRSGGVEVRNKHGALLKQLLYCKACDRAMTHTFTGKGDRRYRYYKCIRAIKSGRHSCPTPALPALEIEQTVLEQFREIAADPRLRAEVLQQANRNVAGELEALCGERSGLRCEVQRHHAEIRGLATGGEQGAAVIADLHERVDRGERRLAEIDVQIGQLERSRLEQADVDAAFAEFGAVWDTLSPREQCQALAQVIRRIEFDATDESLGIEFAIGEAA